MIDNGFSLVLDCFKCFRGWKLKMFTSQIIDTEATKCSFMWIFEYQLGLKTISGLLRNVSDVSRCQLSQLWGPGGRRLTVTYDSRDKSVIKLVYIVERKSDVWICTFTAHENFKSHRIRTNSALDTSPLTQ